MIFGYEDCASHVRNSLPPRFIDGRWCSLANGSNWILKKTFEQVKAVVNRVFKPSSIQKKQSTPVVCSDPDAELSIQQHREKLGKWRQRTSQVANCIEFRKVMELATPVHNVLLHIQKWLHVHQLEGHLPKFVISK